ncbi:MAG TPA: cupin domain-containing protein [Blastocatellia bacterium]|nr:cupin domain-containing protein [Blastocatellia bacterium]
MKMTTLYGGAAVIEAVDYTEVEGTRKFRVPVSRRMGARDIAQAISVYSAGRAPAQSNREGEEVLYVVRGSGACHIDGQRYELEPGTGVFIPPGSVYQIDNTSDSELEIVSVCCPEETGDAPAVSPKHIVRERDQKSIATGDRTFKLLINQDAGCLRVTQFIGVIPPGRAPMHHHTYEEAIYIIEGAGRLWTEQGSADFRPGASIYLPRGVAHSLENTGETNIRLLGVFHPSGSPAARY